MPDDLMNMAPPTLAETLKYLGPQDLAALKACSTYLGNAVDNAVNAMSFKDDETNSPIESGTLTTGQVLKKWNDGDISTNDSFWSKPADPRERYDYQFDQEDSKSEHIALVKYFYEGDTGDGIVDAATLMQNQSNFLDYTKALLKDGRLLDEDGNPLASSVTPVDAVERWAKGELSWVSPYAAS